MGLARLWGWPRLGQSARVWDDGARRRERLLLLVLCKLGIHLALAGEYGPST